jgi:monoamine oxidase
MSQDRRISEIADRCEEFLPGFKSRIICSRILSWDEHPYIGVTRSSVADLSREQVAAIRAREGRIHFAGEHAATLKLGWMEGAIESAHRVAEEISELITD